MDNYATKDEVMIKNAASGIDDILAAAKRMKSAHNKHESRIKAEENLREEARELMKKAHAVTGEMMNDDLSTERKKELMQENAHIQKELGKTNNKIDRSIDKGNEMWEAVVEAHRQLVALVNGEKNEVQEQKEDQPDTSQESEEVEESEERETEEQAEPQGS